MAFDQIINNLTDKEAENVKKILFTGLDDAGKTSVILSIKNELAKVAHLKPTKGAQKRIFKFLGHHISEWDLGGQEVYRISYLKKPSSYFGGTEIAVYVIDMQNYERLNESVSYLRDVIKQFEELEISPPLHILLHKSDPQFIAKDGMEDWIDGVKNEIAKKINYKKISYHKTTIYDIPKIISVMSEILLSLFSMTELVKSVITEFANKTSSEGVMVIDDNSLVIGGYYKSKGIEDMLKGIIPFLLGLNDNMIIDQDTKHLDNGTIIQKLGKYFFLRDFSIEGEDFPYFLLLVRDDAEVSDESLKTFIGLLGNLFIS